MIEWNETIGSYISLQKLLKNAEETADLKVLVQDDDTGSFVGFKLHRMVLATQSESFACMFNKAKRSRDGSMLEVEIQWISTDMFQVIVNWMYKRESPITYADVRTATSKLPTRPTSDLFRSTVDTILAAGRLGIHDLQNKLIKVWDSVNAIPDVDRDPWFYFMGMSDIYSRVPGDESKKLRSLCTKVLREIRVSEIMDYLEDKNVFDEGFIKDVELILEGSKLRTGFQPKCPPASTSKAEAVDTDSEAESE